MLVNQQMRFPRLTGVTCVSLLGFSEDLSRTDREKIVLDKCLFLKTNDENWIGKYAVTTYILNILVEILGF